MLVIVDVHVNVKVLEVALASVASEGGDPVQDRNSIHYFKQRVAGITLKCLTKQFSQLNLTWFFVLKLLMNHFNRLHLVIPWSSIEYLILGLFCKILSTRKFEQLGRVIEHLDFNDLSCTFPIWKKIHLQNWWILWIA